MRLDGGGRQEVWITRTRTHVHQKWNQTKQKTKKQTINEFSGCCVVLSFESIRIWILSLQNNYITTHIYYIYKIHSPSNPKGWFESFVSEYMNNDTDRDSNRIELSDRIEYWIFDFFHFSFDLNKFFFSIVSRSMLRCLKFQQYMRAHCTNLIINSVVPSPRVSSSSSYRVCNVYVSQFQHLYVSIVIRNKRKIVQQ